MTPSRSGRTARDRLRGAAEHLLGAVTGRHAAGCVPGSHGHDRGLVEHDAATALVDEGVGRAEVDRRGPSRAPTPSPSRSCQQARSAAARGAGVPRRAGAGLGRLSGCRGTASSGPGPVAQSSGNQMPISRAADSGESDPCTMFCCTVVPQSRPRSPRIVPGSALVGSVAPARAPEALDAAVALDDDGGDRAGRHELAQRLEERLALVLLVVRVQPVEVGREHLRGRRGGSPSPRCDAAPPR